MGPVETTATAPVMVVDGNSLLHRSYHALAGTGARTVLGEPIWAVRGLLTQVVAAADRIGPRAIVIGFDDPDASVRRERWPSYKAQRAEKLPTLTRQLATAAEVLAELGAQVVTPTGLEADDVLASTAAGVTAAGGRTVCVTSDRDAFALIDPSTTVLRVINGGVEGSPMMTPDRLVLLLGVRPEQYADFAALRGDASDNLPGVDGIGPKRAAALLSHFGTAEAVFADAVAGGEQVAAVLGPRWPARLADPAVRERWASNREVMAFHRDVGVDCRADAGGGRLPFHVDVVDRVMLAHGLPGTARLARRVLADLADPDPTPPSLDELGWDPTARWRSTPAPPPLPARRPDPQPTLF